MKKIFVFIFLLIFCLFLAGCTTSETPTVEMIYGKWYNCQELPSLKDPFVKIYDGSYSIEIERNNTVKFKTIDNEVLIGQLTYEKKQLYRIEIKIIFENNTSTYSGRLQIVNGGPYLNFKYEDYEYTFTSIKSISKDELETYSVNFNSFLWDCYINDNYPTLEEVKENEMYKNYTYFHLIDPCCNYVDYIRVNKVNISINTKYNELNVLFSDGKVENKTISSINDIILVKKDGTFERLEEIQEGKCYLTSYSNLYYFECDHLWDSGVHNDCTYDNHIIDYNCTLCDNKKKEYVNINFDTLSFISLQEAFDSEFLTHDDLDEIAKIKNENNFEDLIRKIHFDDVCEIVYLYCEMNNIPYERFQYAENINLLDSIILFGEYDICNGFYGYAIMFNDIFEYEEVAGVEIVDGVVFNYDTSQRIIVYYTYREFELISHQR